MSFIWASALKDLRRRLRDPVGLIVWLGIPLVILTLLTLAFGSGGSSVKPQAHLLVADEDRSLLSGLLLGAFGQGPLEELVRVEQVETDEGRQRISRGDGSALLLIPEGFGERVLLEQPVTLTLLTNPSQRILPGIVEETLSVMVDGAFYAQRLFGETLRELAEGPPGGARVFPNETIAGFSVTVNDTVDRLADYLLPPVINLENTVEVEESEEFNFGGMFFLGMFFMSLLFMAQGMSDDVWRERAQGTLRRALTTPRAITELLAGKLLAGAILIGSVSLIGLPLGCWLFDLGMARLPFAVIWGTFSGTVLLAAFTLAQLFAASQRAGAILGSLVTFPLLLVGGSFFPFEIMPDFLAAIGRWTPNGWALEQLKAILAGSAGAGELGAAFAGLVAVLALASLISAWRLRSGFAQG